MVSTQVTLGNSAQKETDLAAAATVNLGAASTAKIRITGTGTISSFGTVPNKLRFVRFAGAATLVHNPISLILPGAANITTAPGDAFVAISDAAGNWNVFGMAGGGLLGLEEIEAPRNVELGSGAYVNLDDAWRYPFFSKAANYTLTADDNHRFMLFTANATVTLPAASECPDDWTVNLKARGGTITLNRAGSDTIDGTTTISLTTGLKAVIFRTSATSFESF